MLLNADQMEADERSKKKKRVGGGGGGGGSSSRSSGSGSGSKRQLAKVVTGDDEVDDDDDVAGHVRRRFTTRVCVTLATAACVTVALVSLAFNYFTVPDSGHASAAQAGPALRVCNFKDVSTGLELVPRTGSCGMIHDAVRNVRPTCPAAPEFHSFACHSPEYRDFLHRNTFSTPGCVLQVDDEPPSDGPFAPGDVVLMTGNSWVMQLGNALMARHKGAIVEYRGGLGLSLAPGTECGCMTRKLTETQCLEIARSMAQRFRVVDGVSAGDGYSDGMKGLPDRLVTVKFRNGALLHIATNHLFMVYPTFGITKGLAPAFNTTVPGLTKVIGYTASSSFSARACPGASGFPSGVRAGTEDPVRIIDELHAGGFKGELYLMDMDWKFNAGDDVLSGYFRGARGDHGVKEDAPAVDDPTTPPTQPSACCFTKAVAERVVSAGDSLGFTVKAVPSHMQYGVKVPFITERGRQIRTSASHLFHLVGAPSVPHACEPGLPDMVRDIRNNNKPYFSITHK